MGDKNKKARDENLVFKRFSAQGFLKDLASAEAVITNGGFTLITECIYLKKPVLSQPIQGQFEQILNAIYLEKLGYGKFCEHPTLTDLHQFFRNLPKYRKRLEQYSWKKETDALIKELETKIQLQTKHL